MTLKVTGQRLADHLLAQLEAEGRRTRRAIEAVPDGRDDWTPHPRSMPMGRLTYLVADILAWIAMIVHDESLDLKPADGPRHVPPLMRDRAERLQVLDGAVTKAHDALKHTDDEHLMKPWRLLEAGRIVSEQPRHVVIQDTFMHLAHHRGQLTVYLRMCNAPVPAIYGPSADDHRFD